jgi:polyhydroxybutyrate depolymerase
VARARCLSLFIGIVSVAVLVAGCAAVPGIDDAIETTPSSPGGQHPGGTIALGGPATGPARPSWGCNVAPANLAPFDGSRTIGAGGPPREMLVHVPALQAGKPVPLVVDMHGLGTNATLQSNVTGWNAQADTEGFAVIHPQGLANIWTYVPEDSNPDLAFIKAAVLNVMTERCIDVSRVYATGLSMGALLSSALACKAADVFAAVGLVSGMRWGTECDPAPPRPVIVFYGNLDCVLPWYGTLGPCLAIGAPGRTMPTAPVPPDQDGGFPQVEGSLANWAKHNGCSLEPQVEVVSDAVSHRVYPQCQDGSDVELYFIDGGGHTWPGSEVFIGMEANDPSAAARGVTTKDIKATDLMWAFFQRHQLPG